LDLGRKISERGYQKGKPLYSKHLLTGILKCGKCGENIAIVSGGAFAKYGCSAHANKKACGNDLRISKEIIESAFMEQLSALLPENIFEDLRVSIFKNPVTGRQWLFDNVRHAVIIPGPGASWRIDIEAPSFLRE
jgi:hypothetical protein